MKFGKGIFYAVIAYLTWGLLPLFWKLLENVPSVDILAHRILWSAVFTLSFCLLKKRKYLIEYFSNFKVLGSLAIAGILVSTNWGIYIYAVVSGQIIEASLGYFVNPLVSIALGMIFLGEKLNKLQLVAFLLAILGVGYQTVNYGHFPWIAAILAISFGVYGLIKKKMNCDSMTSLAIETIVVAPIALVYLFVSEKNYHMESCSVFALLVMAGLVTALPLYWFGMAAVRIKLYAIGFLQYLAPSIKLLMGVFLFNETFTATHAVSFSLIWTGLALYTVDIVYRTTVKLSTK